MTVLEKIKKYNLKFDPDVMHLRMKHQRTVNLDRYALWADRLFSFDEFLTYLFGVSEIPFGKTNWAFDYARKKLALLKNLTSAEETQIKAMWAAHGLQPALWDLIETYARQLLMHNVPSFDTVLFKEEFEDLNMPSFKTNLFKEEFESLNMPSFITINHQEEFEG